MLKGKKFSHLKEDDRIKIEVLLQQGVSIRSISILLGRSASTISREISRNGPRKYKACRAQEFTARRHRQKRKHTVFDQRMIDFVVTHLKAGKWSPELICIEGRKWRKKFISHEWIYQWIWKMKFSMAEKDKPYQLLYKLLRHANRKWKRGRKKRMRGNIIARQWIDKRPGVVEKRERSGDLEADIVLGKNRQPGLLVVLDRRSRYVWIRKLLNKDAGNVMSKLERLCGSIANIKTITFDNDQSFAEHYRLHRLGIDTFFTHPYSSQEKGSVENRIGLIRMFFPKKTDFTRINEKQVLHVQNLLNHRPMKMFNYRSPYQIHIS